MSKEIVKKWSTLIKSKSRENNWKFKEYFIFKTEGQFLFDAMFWINGKSNSLTGVLHFKFAEIDKLFWQLTVDNDKLENHPLSLQVNGSHMVRPIGYYNFDLKYISEENLTELLGTINEKVVEIKARFSAGENFLTYIRENKVLNEYSFLTNLLFLKKYKELLFFIEYCRQHNITSGITFYKNGVSQDYFDKLTSYIHDIG